MKTQSNLFDTPQSFHGAHDEAWEIRREIKRNRSGIRKIAKAHMRELCNKCEVAGMGGSECADHMDLNKWMVRYIKIEWDDYMKVWEMGKRICANFKRK